MASSKEHNFWIVTTGNGLLPCGHKVGSITVKSKSKNKEDLINKAYGQLFVQIPNIDIIKKHFSFIEKL